MSNDQKKEKSEGSEKFVNYVITAKQYRGNPIIDSLGKCLFAQPQDPNKPNRVMLDFLNALAAGVQHGRRDD